MRFEIQFVTLRSIFVFTLILQRLTGVQEDRRVLQVVFASQRALVTVDGFGVIENAVALALPVRYVAFYLTVFLRR